MLNIRNLLLVLLQGTVCHALQDLQNSHRCHLVNIRRHVVKFFEGVLIDIMPQLRLPVLRVVVLWACRSS
jgi:hypothetical protein